MKQPTMNRIGFVAALAICAAGAAQAATLDTVTVSAVTPLAAEAGKVPGRIRFSRTGSIGSLTVTYDTNGSTATSAATEGSYLGGPWPVGDKDYQTFANPVSGFPNRYTITIPAGSTSVDLLVQPFQDTCVESSETVVANLVDDSAYIVGPRFSTLVTIADDDTTTTLSMPKFSPTEYLAGQDWGPPFEALFRMTFSNPDQLRYITTQMSGRASSSDYSLTIMYRHYGGAIVGAAVTDGGNGYTSVPSISIAAGTAIKQLNLVTGGSGYTSPPLVTFPIPANGRVARARAILNGGTVSGLVLCDGGEGYTSAPTLTFTRVDGSVGADATATATMSQALVAATMKLGFIEPSSLNKFWSSAPEVTITGGAGSGAVVTADNAAAVWRTSTAYSVNDYVTTSGGLYICVTAGTSSPIGNGPTGNTAGISDNTVTWNYVNAAAFVLRGFTIQNPGRGYTSAPSITYVNPQTFIATTIGTAFLSVERVWIVDGGGGYMDASTPPVLTIDAPPAYIPAGFGYPGNSSAVITPIVRIGTASSPAPGDTILDRRTTNWKFSAGLARNPINGSSASYGDGKKDNTTLAVTGTGGSFSQGDIITIGGQGQLYQVLLVDNNVLHVSPALKSDVADDAVVTNAVAFTSGAGAENTTNLLQFYSLTSPNAAATAQAPYWGLEFGITPNDDASAEGAEDVTLRVVSSNAFAINDPTVATMYIADDDSTADVQLGANASEPDQAGYARITLSNALPIDITVPFAVTSATSPDGGAGYATLGVDCVDMTDDGINGSVTIPAGTTSIDIPVQPIAEIPDIPEGSERLTITLLNSPDYLLAGGPNSQQNPSATINIVDRQGTVGFATYLPGQVPAFPASVAADLDGEVSESMTVQDKASVRVLFANRSNGANQPFAVAYDFVTGSTATAGSDFTALSGTVTIPANQPKATLSVAAVGGQSVASIVLESGTRTLLANEFIMIGSAPYQIQVGATLSTSPQTVTVTPPLVANAPIGDPVGLEAYDYTLGRPVDIQVSPRDDQVVEGDEILVLTVLTGQGYQVAENSSNVVVTIHDDEPVLQITAGANPVESAVGGAAAQSSFIVSYGATALTRAVPFTIAIGAGTAVEGVDFATLSRSYTIPANTSSIAIPVTVKDDLIKEGSETIVVSIVAPPTNPAYAVSPVAGTATMSIGDDEPVVAIQAVAGRSEGVEGGLAPAFQIVNQTAAVSGGVQLARDLQVAVSVTGGTINRTPPDEDLITYPTTVTILANNSVSAPVALNVIDDTLIEGDETVIISITTNPGYSIDPAAASVTLTIKDNAEPTLTITGSSVIAEPATGTVTAIAFTINAVNAGNGSVMNVPVDVQVNLNFTGTATKVSDYTVPASTTIAAGTNSTTVSIDVKADTTYEGNETIIATLVAGSPARYAVSSTLGAATVTIDDFQDNAASVQVAAAAVENAAEPLTPGKLRVTCTETQAGALAGVGGSITVPITVAGTATGGVDYVALPSSVTFTAAPQSIDVPVVVIGDALTEGIETVTITVGADTVTPPAQPRRWQVPASTATASITIADFTPGSGKPPVDPLSSGGGKSGCGLGSGLGLIGLGLLLALRLRQRRG